MLPFLDAAAADLQPWSDLYNGSVAVSSGLTFAHLGGLLVAGGFAVATDRAVIRAGRMPAPERRYVLGELRAVHRPVLLALGVVVLTGLAMLGSDVRTFLPSPIFWIKMSLIGLLLANGLLLRRAEAALRVDPLQGGAWTRLRNAALRSGGLWMLTVLFGVLLTSAG